MDTMGDRPASTPASSIEWSLPVPEVSTHP
jgi:hypothetical protein